jgi:hypothetical protein
MLLASKAYQMILVELRQYHPIGHQHHCVMFDGLMSEDFADILGGAAAIGPHKGSSSGFDAFSGCDFGGFATALDKNQKEKNKIKWASFKPISLVDMLSNKALRLG